MKSIGRVSPSRDTLCFNFKDVPKLFEEGVADDERGKHNGDHGHQLDENIQTGACGGFKGVTHGIAGNSS